MRPDQAAFLDQKEVGFDGCICHLDAFAHNGEKTYRCLFSGCPQAFILGIDVCAETQCRHIRRNAQRVFGPLFMNALRSHFRKARKPIAEFSKHCPLWSFQPKCIQMGFCNIHANRTINHLRHVLYLSCRLITEAFPCWS
jgi:hypothetical protein